MEFEVNDNTFYILVNNAEKINKMTVFDSLQPSIKKVKEYLRQGLDSDNMELMSINYKDDRFEIKSIPWNIIAMELIKE